jgi:Flp pilus assembly protein TadD
VRAPTAEYAEPQRRSATMTPGTPFALRLAAATGALERGDHLTAARQLVELVDEAHASADTLHGTVELRLLLARAYFGSAQLGRAEATLRGVVADEPTDGYAHLMLGRTLQRQGRHADARQHLTLAGLLGDHARPTAYGEPPGQAAG